MSENRWREILLAELKTVRLVCGHKVRDGDKTRDCGAIVEIPLDQLANVGDCPLCQNSLRPPTEASGTLFARLASAITGLQAAKGCSVSFVVPCEPES